MDLRRWISLILLVSVSGFLAGCASGKSGPEERRKVEFTVVEERQLPQELLQTIEQNKKSEIRMTYADGEALYLIRGYGEQKTGGYSISVVECTEDDKSIYFDTRLIGPADPEHLSKDPSYPYVAVRIGMREKNAEIT